MAKKLTIDDVKVGTMAETRFLANPVKDSPYRFRATHLDGRRAPKVVLCKDPRVRPGVHCLVRVTAIDKPDRPDRGLIEVELVRHLDFRLEGVYLEPMVAKKLQILLESGLNILLDGPQGCGKTVVARAIAETLGMRFVFFNCSAVIDPSDFMATMQVRASERGPVTDFVKTELLEALEEAKGNPEVRSLVFLDELNRCNEHARNSLMPALDSTRRLFNPVANTFLEIPDNVQFIAAVNTGDEFSGTYGIDAAQLDRFAPVQMDYLPPVEEVRLLGKRHPGLGKALLEDVVAVAARLRSAEDLGRGLSVRATDEACVYLEHPVFERNRRQMLSEVLKSSFCGRYPGRWNRSDTDAGAAWSLVKAALRDRAADKA